MTRGRLETFLAPATPPYESFIGDIRSSLRYHVPQPASHCNFLSFPSSQRHSDTTVTSNCNIIIYASQGNSCKFQEHLIKYIGCFLWKNMNVPRQCVNAAMQKGNEQTSSSHMTERTHVPRRRCCWCIAHRVQCVTAVAVPRESFIIAAALL